MDALLWDDPCCDPRRRICRADIDAHTAMQRLRNQSAPALSAPATVPPSSVHRFAASQRDVRWASVVAADDQRAPRASDRRRSHAVTNESYRATRLCVPLGSLSPRDWMKHRQIDEAVRARAALVSGRGFASESELSLGCPPGLSHIVLCLLALCSRSSRCFDPFSAQPLSGLVSPPFLRGSRRPPPPPLCPPLVARFTPPFPSAAGRSACHLARGYPSSSLMWPVSTPLRPPFQISRASSAWSFLPWRIAYGWRWIGVDQR